eukprot:s92_g38.t1
MVRIAIVLLSLFLTTAEELSCRGRCNLLMLRAACQCTKSCVQSGSCCQDYDSLCAPNHQEISQWPSGAKDVGTVKIVTIGNVSMEASATCPSFGPAWVSILVPSWVPVQVQQERKMFLYLPQGARKAPLWFAFHGTGQHADGFVSWTGLGKFAAEKGIALVALQGLKSSYYKNLIRFNVGANSEPISPDGPNDVEFVQLALQAILQLPCIDKDRVYCTGYSNGGRFCSRLASQMSEHFAAIAPVSGLRYPFKNNATRAVPILAFHGDADPINPFYGHGGPYWNISEPEALQLWATFNGCRWSSVAPMFFDVPYDHMSIALYDQCRSGATVKLLKLHGDGHQWPGCKHGIQGLGKVSSIDGNKMMHAFFDSKTLSSSVSGLWPNFETAFNKFATNCESADW